MQHRSFRSVSRPVGGTGHLTLRLQRTYHPGGTNGTLYHNGRALCHTIELAWRDNQRQISCIPEGTYRLYRGDFPKHGDQLALHDVPGRDGILIHPANHALRELRGCIAPVTKHTGPGKGIHSRIALDRIKDLVYPVLEAGEDVFLEIRATKPEIRDHDL